LTGKSRRKGASGEREVRDAIKAHGFSAARGGYAGHKAAPDVIHDIPGCHIEVKRREQIHMGDWLKQAEKDAHGLIPIVVWRRSRESWRADVSLEFLLQLLEDRRKNEENITNASLQPHRLQ
jgi:Holliday junction resolvase